MLVPESRATVLLEQPILSADNTDAFRTKNINFEVALETLSTSLETIPPAVIDSNSDFTERQVNAILVADQTYDWQVYINNNQYSALPSFSLATASLSASDDIIAYPNPVNFSNGKQNNFPPLPNSSVELTVLTISGETALHKTRALDSWQWNGSNATVPTVATCSYLWYSQIDSNTYFRKIVTT